MSLIKTTKELIKSVEPLTSDQDIIRSAIIAELDATSLYATQIENLNNDKAKEVLRHIMNEEKEHTGELMCVLFELDEKQAEVFSDMPESCIKE